MIYYDLNNGKNKRHLPKSIMLIIRKKFMKNYPYYFNLDKNVKQICVNQIEDKRIRQADISISSSPHTAYKVDKLGPDKGKKIYFIQGYENWHTKSESELHNTYKLGHKNIVIAKWLKKIVDYHSGKDTVISFNGIDLNIFKIKTADTFFRKKYSIAMLYHDSENKGCKYGIDALYKLKEKYNELEVNMFGFPERPDDFPDWINYTKKASEEEIANILNNSSIFMCTSIFEGFGLPGLEAMACGCALVTTDCKGVLEYANENNSIICEPKNAQALYEAVCKIFDDEVLRAKLIENATATAKFWSLDRANIEFEKNILE